MICTRVCSGEQLFSLGSANRTHACARTAVQACVCINHILSVFLGNTFCRAFTRTCTASDALIVNYICHHIHLQPCFAAFLLQVVFIVAQFFEMSRAFGKMEKIKETCNILPSIMAGIARTPFKIIGCFLKRAPFGILIFLVFPKASFCKIPRSTNSHSCD